MIHRSEPSRPDGRRRRTDSVAAALADKAASDPLTAATRIQTYLKAQGATEAWSTLTLCLGVIASTLSAAAKDSGPGNVDATGGGAPRLDIQLRPG